MHTSGSSYTKLESLLLFQSLYAYGVAPSIFGTISDLLKNNPVISSHENYQSGRLSPDALRSFYLDRLRREIEYEQESKSSNDGTSTGDTTQSRKRKIPVASLPTVQGSLQHQHLIPKLVTKLYASYRNEITEQIRAEEHTYERLQRELDSIERGEWDGQLKNKIKGQTQTSGSSSKAKTSEDPSRTSPSQDAQASPSTPNKSLATDQRGDPSTPQSLAASALPPDNQAQPLIPPNFQPPHNTAYNGVLDPSLSPYPHEQQLTPGAHQDLARATQRLGQTGPTEQQHQPSQGIPTVGFAASQYGVSASIPQPYSPTNQHYPAQPPPGQQAQQQRGHVLQHGQPPYPAYPQSSLPPPQAGFMLPPFQVAPQDPSRVHPQAAIPSPAGAPPPYSQASTPTASRPQSRPSTRTSNLSKPTTPAHPLSSQTKQPFSTPASTRSTLSTVGTTVSAKSFWKRQSFCGSTGTPASPRPEPEPVDDFVPLDTSKQSPNKPKAQRKTRGKGKGKDKEVTKEKEAESAAEAEHAEVTNEVETRSGRSRRKPNTRQNRRGSVVSSRAGGSVRGRSRSQSVLSHTDTVAADSESQAGQRIKSERGTSIDVEDESVGTPSQASTRRRGVAAHFAPSRRRKRNAREASLAETEDHFSTPGASKIVIAPRYFSKMSAPIMHDINSHKHASTFTTAVRAKDAEGYYEIIKRPTHLKSIQKAIASGAKQVAAAASDTPVGSPGGGGGFVELPVTSDTIPPKSIVNAAQLEKELMRMFVNAVMFNPGEEGVVEDARQMFETVQSSVSNWRNVERGSARAEVEMTPAAEDEEPAQVSKRRKL